MEIGPDNLLDAPLQISINSVAILLKEWCNRNTRKPECVMVGETLFRQLVCMFNGEKITVVTNRSSPIVELTIIKGNVLSNYIIVV